MNSLRISTFGKLMKTGYSRYFRYKVTRLHHDHSENIQNEATQSQAIPDEAIQGEEMKKDREHFKKVESKRLLEFRKKLKEKVPDDVEDAFGKVYDPNDPLPPWPNNTNPHTGEIGGPRGPEPTRYGDWERKGICVDF